ncbi:MAG TPA: hypothetical protein VL974_13635 [Magnetospirillum sp.]|nr:hypothetical protein [Magnetospirillum sp.]
MSGGPIGIVTGLRAEARLLRGLPLVACAGSEPEAAARALVAAGARRLLSFGLAGGLDPALPAGTLVLANRVMTADGQVWATDPSWRHACARPEMTEAPLAGSNDAVAHCADKATLRNATGAVAVDMESHHVARVAAEAGLPFLSLRAIADPAHRSLPKAVIKVVDGQGTISTGAVLWAALRHPLAMALLARDAGKAIRALRRAVPFT